MDTTLVDYEDKVMIPEFCTNQSVKGMDLLAIGVALWRSQLD